MVFGHKTWPQPGVPDRCHHVIIPTASESPSTTTAWWPTPVWSFRAPSLCAWACPNSSQKHLDLGNAPGRANTGDKMMTLVASALAGGDCIDDADALRAGGTARVLGFRAIAPSMINDN